MIGRNVLQALPKPTKCSCWNRKRARVGGGQTIDAVVGRGALRPVRLARHLLPRLDRQVLLVTDANAA